ncbi:MAG TPA: multiprotein-bridging factor 1 family protein [Thermoplasmata archaeon]|nr:multiprotein-bridging factor 1 family protein [Thermoplasmata archaeon]
MLCEMCGNDVVATSRVRIEKSVLQLCPSCARFGTPIDPPPAPLATPAAGPAPARPVASGGATRSGRGPRRLEERDLYQEIGELELAADWGQRVRRAREALAWTPEELAKRLNEKKSVVLKIESSDIHPPDALVRKLEHLLKVRLRAEPEAEAPR